MMPSRALLLIGLLPGCAGTTSSERDAPEPNQTTGPTVTAEDIQRSPNRPIEEVLASRFPGVTVTRTADGTLTLRIRGTSTISASNEPLFVIDGIPIEPGPGGALFGINPYDIESIEVLKDAASTSMYGVRGANGVIVIKTKRPDQ